MQLVFVRLRALCVNNWTFLLHFENRIANFSCDCMHRGEGGCKRNIICKYYDSCSIWTIRACTGTCFWNLLHSMHAVGWIWQQKQTPVGSWLKLPKSDLLKKGFSTITNPIFKKMILLLYRPRRPLPLM